MVDRNTQIARVTLKDPAALPPLNTRVVQLKYTSVSNMTDAVQSVLTDKRSRVLADNRTSQLVVVATDTEQLSVDTLIAQLDKPTREVLIETRLVEISSNPTSAKGIDWSGRCRPRISPSAMAACRERIPHRPPRARQAPRYPAVAITRSRLPRQPGRGWCRT